jgi:hypothetical protein
VEFLMDFPHPGTRTSRFSTGQDCLFALAVEALMNLAKLFIRDVGVNLGGGDGGMAEQCLN